jgi:hypothetical protein
MTVLITLTIAGTDTGPFDLYSNVDGYVSAFETTVSKAALLAGYSSALVPNGTTIIRVKSKGTCVNYVDIPVVTTTTTTTTGTPITTTTTTSSSSTTTTTTSSSTTTTTTTGVPVTTTTTTTDVPTTTTTTTTSLPPVPCGEVSSYSGEQGYPITQSVTLGSGTGTVLYSFDAYSVPDRFIVRWDGNVVIDTGYRGTSDYDFGGPNRASFNADLNGQVDPITLVTYPDLTNYPDDGYPRVTSPGGGTTSFNKTSASPTSALVEVYAPMAGTAWQFTMGCPGDVTTTTTTTTVFECVDCRNWEYYFASIPPGGDVIHYYRCSDGAPQTIVLSSGDPTGQFCNCNTIGNPYSDNGTLLTEIGICSTTTTTTTSAPLPASIFLDMSLSLDTTVSDISVQGVPASYASGTPLPNTGGGNTNLTTLEVGGTQTVVITYSCTFGGHKITLIDSLGTITCQNTGIGSNITMTFLNVNIDNITAVQIIAEDGTC